MIKMPKKFDIANFLRYRALKIAVSAGAVLFALFGVVFSFYKSLPFIEGFTLVIAETIFGAAVGLFLGVIARGIGGLLLNELKPFTISLITMLLVGGVGYFIYNAASAYKVYDVYVHVTDEIVFLKYLDESDPRIISHGSKRDEEVKEMDRRIDNSDGPDRGKLRWYDCFGIDCHDSWETMFK